MNIKYNIPKLERILNDLSVLAGISINFCDYEGKTLIRFARKDDFCATMQKEGNNLQKCRRSDADILNKCKQSRQIEHHICYAGLCDLAMPITKKDVVVGYVIMGRIQTPQTAKSPLVSSQLEALYAETPFFTYEKINSMIDLLPQILFASAIEIEFDEFISRVTEYIDTNLQSKLTIALLCSKFHVTKNYLYDAFHSSFNCTVNEYISAQRIKKAILLLTETKELVYRIAELVGIDNYTYFCKLFKRKEGMSPIAYRKRNTPE